MGLVWICWYRAALKHAERTGAPLPDLVGAPTLIIHTYIDALLSPMLERYDATRAGSLRTREHLRRSILRQALDDSTALEDADTEEALGIVLEADHVAILLTGDVPAPDDVAAFVRDSCGAASALTYRHGPDEWMLWLSRPNGFDARQEADLREALGRTGLRAAIGPPSRGGGGLGATGRDAIETARMHALLGAGGGDVLAYADVRLEALLLREPPVLRVD